MVAMQPLIKISYGQAVDLNDRERQIHQDWQVQAPGEYRILVGLAPEPADCTPQPPRQGQITTIWLLENGVLVGAVTCSCHEAAPADRCARHDLAATREYTHRLRSPKKVRDCTYLRARSVG